MNRLVMRRIEFCAGHRLLNHEGACKYLHGHNYIAEVAIIGDDLDSVGRLIDFQVIKDKIKGWIDEHWDHNMILHQDDPLLDIALGGMLDKRLFAGRRPYVLGFNPTAENLAVSLFDKATHLIQEESSLLKVASVRIWETPSCCAEFFA